MIFMAPAARCRFPIWGIADPLSAAFIDAPRPRPACRCNPDFNGAPQEGAGFFQTTTRRGRRASAAVAYLRPAKGRNNLQIETSALAQRILFEGRRAAAIEYRQAGALRTARARKEILVSGGAFNSPQLLQLSGVGPAELLQQAWHRCRAGCAGRRQRSAGSPAGQGGDALLASASRSTISSTSRFARSWPALRYAAFRTGPLTIAAGTSGAFFKTNPRLATPDIQIHFLPFSTDKMGEKLHPFSGFTASVCQLRPESRGSLRIRSADPAAPPEIRINYLATEVDRTANVEGLKILRKILQAPALKPYVVEEVDPGAEGRERRGVAGLLPRARQHHLSSDLDLPDGQ